MSVPSSIGKLPYTLEDVCMRRGEIYGQMHDSLAAMASAAPDKTFGSCVDDLQRTLGRIKNPMSSPDKTTKDIARVLEYLRTSPTGSYLSPALRTEQRGANDTSIMHDYHVLTQQRVVIDTDAYLFQAASIPREVKYSRGTVSGQIVMRHVSRPTGWSPILLGVSRDIFPVNNSTSKSATHEAALIVDQDIELSGGDKRTGYALPIEGLTFGIALGGAVLELSNLTSPRVFYGPREGIRDYLLEVAADGSKFAYCHPLRRLYPEFTTHINMEHKIPLQLLQDTLLRPIDPHLLASEMAKNPVYSHTTSVS
jgi:hypothetical protein